MSVRSSRARRTPGSRPATAPNTRNSRPEKPYAVSSSRPMPSRVSSPQTEKTTAAAMPSSAVWPSTELVKLVKPTASASRCAASPPRGRRSASASGQRGDDQVEADVPEVVPDVLVPQVARLGAAGQRVVDAVGREVDAVALGVHHGAEPEQRPGAAAGAGAAQGAAGGAGDDVRREQVDPVGPPGLGVAHVAQAGEDRAGVVQHDVADGQHEQPAAERPAVPLAVRRAHGRAAPKRLLRQMLEMRTFSPV